MFRKFIAIAGAVGALAAATYTPQASADPLAGAIVGGAIGAAAARECRLFIAFSVGVVAGRHAATTSGSP